MPASDSEDRFRRAIARFDEANSADPTRERFEGEDHPRELLYSRRMSAWLERLEPQAPEAVRLAVRCQHLRRWTIPRDQYPQGRAGYLKWRTTLARYHADEAETILREVGYDEATIARVRSLLLKQKLKQDPQVQLLEDVVCVVFLESYFADFSRKHEEQKILDIVRKTWRKMTPRGREAALALDLPSEARALVERALEGDPALNPDS
ncbi:MAG: DUF4202 domain-containing protein [Acidobacteria bacterium]|nr:DUF4202 domain-containing protein [Acidobacteriota bacterium]